MKKKNTACSTSGTPTSGMRFEVERLPFLRELSLLKNANLFAGGRWDKWNSLILQLEKSILTLSGFGKNAPYERVETRVSVLGYTDGKLAVSSDVTRNLLEVLNLRTEKLVSFEVIEGRLIVQFISEKGDELEDSLSLFFSVEPDLFFCPQEGEPWFSLTARELREAIEQVAYAVSCDENREMLTGVNFKTQEGKIVLAATDGNRLSRKKLNEQIVKVFKQEDLLISKISLDRLKVMLAGKNQEQVEVKIQCSEEKYSFVSFKCKEIYLSSPLIKGNFPNYESIIPESQEFKLSLPRLELSKAIRIAQLFTDKRSYRIFLTFSRQGLMVASELSEDGQAKARVHFDSFLVRKNDIWVLDETRDYFAEELVLAFNANYLRQSLATLGKESLVHFQASDFKTVVFFENLAGDVLHLIMPMNLN